MLALVSVVVPDAGYLSNVQALCKKHNVLLICDEIQTVRLFISPHDVDFVLVPLVPDALLSDRVCVELAR